MFTDFFCKLRHSGQLGQVDIVLILAEFPGP
jgi:hypothetical protein